MEAVIVGVICLVALGIFAFCVSKIRDSGIRECTMGFGVFFLSLTLICGLISAICV